jgi:hypothetical protein
VWKQLLRASYRGVWSIWTVAPPHRSSNRTTRGRRRQGGSFDSRPTTPSAAGLQPAFLQQFADRDAGLASCPQLSSFLITFVVPRARRRQHRFHCHTCRHPLLSPPTRSVRGLTWSLVTRRRRSATSTAILLAGRCSGALVAG